MRYRAVLVDPRNGKEHWRSGWSPLIWANDRRPANFGGISVDVDPRGHYTVDHHIEWYLGSGHKLAGCGFATTVSTTTSAGSGAR